MELIFYQNNKKSVRYRLLVGFSINIFFFFTVAIHVKIFTILCKERKCSWIFLLKFVDLKKFDTWKNTGGQTKYI